MTNTLTKADIVEAIQEGNGYSRNQSYKITETLFEIIKESLESGEDVMISGFGKFQVKNKRRRKGRNPVTNEDLILPPRRVVTFKCSGRLRNRINNGWIDEEWSATTYRYLGFWYFVNLLIFEWVRDVVDKRDKVLRDVRQASLCELRPDRSDYKFQGLRDG